MSIKAKQFVVVEAGEVDPTQVVGNILLIDANGDPWSPGGDSGPTSVAWGDVSGKPDTFPPIVGSTATTAAAGDHTHTPASVGAAPVSHSHAIADVTGLQSALDTKAAATDLSDLTARVAALEGDGG